MKINYNNLSRNQFTILNMLTQSGIELQVIWARTYEP